MTTARRRHEEGAALATALLLTLILLTLGMSFLTFCQRDLQFQRREQVVNQAQNLARAGIEYFNFLDNKIPSQAPAMGVKITKVVVTGVEDFQIERVTVRDYVSRGRVYDSTGRIIAEREIYVPDASMDDSYDAHL
jgi:hypothetical protein